MATGAATTCYHLKELPPRSGELALGLLSDLYALFRWSPPGRRRLIFTTHQKTDWPLLVLMPGMDGNGDLFAPFLKALPPEVDTRVIRYPGDQVLSYGELGPMVAEQLPTDGAFVLLAESYSGPLAVQLAAAGPAGLRGLVLCATFLTRPVSGWKRLAGMLIRAPVMAVLPPAWALRRFLLGPQAPDALVHQLRDAIRSVESRVLTQRMREALVIDVREDFRRVGVPTLCIRAEFDWLIDARTNEVMKALNPLVEICSMAAPHLVLQTRPEEAAAVVLDFIRRTKPNPTVQPYS